MPQLPTNTAEEYGADDEVKEYRQEDDEGSENSTVDVVNDIKSDLIKKDAEDHTFDSGKEDSNFVELHGRNIKGETGQSVYGRPAPVIVGPHSKLPVDSSQTPIAQLIAFPQRYYEHTGYPPGSTVQHNPPHHPAASYASASQIHMPLYARNDRGYYERPWQHGQVASFPPPPHGYTSYYPPGKTGEPRPVPYLDYRPHPMGAQNPGVIPYIAQVGPGYHPQGPGEHKSPGKDKRNMAHVKKPLNAFMLYMKEMRPKIAAECTLKESAAINQILGKRWHALDRSEQAKYYEMARKERALHMQLYPGWSARDNYAVLGKKKKRRKDKNQELNPKKCRARYGLDRQDQWCKPCRRKKKCIRFLAGADGGNEEGLEEGDHEENTELGEDKNSDVKIEDNEMTENHPHASESEEAAQNVSSQPPPLLQMVPSS
eukprot:gene11733-12953_t